MKHTYRITRTFDPSSPAMPYRAVVGKAGCVVGVVTGRTPAVVQRAAEALASLDAIEDRVAPQWSGTKTFDVDDGR